MSMQQRFTTIAVDDLVSIAAQMKRDGYRAVQMHCTKFDEGVTATYTFVRDHHEDVYENYQIHGLDSSVVIPSLQGMFLGLFPFENEAADLFGLHIEGMTLDFAGNFYALAEKEPMTIMSPQEKAARDKAARAAAKKKSEDKPQSDQNESNGSTQKDDLEALIEQKTAGLSPEKAEKIAAALRAKAAKSKKQEASTPKKEEE